MEPEHRGQWVVPSRQDGLMSILTPIFPDNQTLPMLHNQVCRCVSHPNEPRLTSQDEWRRMHADMYDKTVLQSDSQITCPLQSPPLQLRLLG